MNIVKCKLVISLFIVLFVFCGTATAVRVQDIDLGPVVKLIDSSKNELDTVGLIDNTQDILISLELVNGEDYWLCWTRWDYDFEISKDGNSKETMRDDYSGNECLPPNSKKQIFIPLTEYNNLDDEDRLGTWMIKPSAGLSTNVNCFENSDMAKNLCGSSLKPTYSGNIIEFKVEKDNPTTHLGWAKVWNWMTKGYKGIAAVLSFLIAILTVLVLLKKLRL